MGLLFFMRVWLQTYRDNNAIAIKAFAEHPVGPPPPGRTPGYSYPHNRTHSRSATALSTLRIML